MALFLFNMVAVCFRIYRLWFVLMVDGDELVKVSFSYSNGSSIDTKVLVKQTSDWKVIKGTDSSRIFKCPHPCGLAMNDQNG